MFIFKIKQKPINKFKKFHSKRTVFHSKPTVSEIYTRLNKLHNLSWIDDLTFKTIQKIPHTEVNNGLMPGNTKLFINKYLSNVDYLGKCELFYQFDKFDKNIMHNKPPDVNINFNRNQSKLSNYNTIYDIADKLNALDSDHYLYLKSLQRTQTRNDIFEHVLDIINRQIITKQHIIVTHNKSCVYDFRNEYDTKTSFKILHNVLGFLYPNLYIIHIDYSSTSMNITDALFTSLVNNYIIRGSRDPEYEHLSFCRADWDATPDYDITTCLSSLYEEHKIKAIIFCNNLNPYNPIYYDILKSIKKLDSYPNFYFFINIIH